jgi:hypothetical protein
MTDRADPHDGWTPEPQEEIQPGDPWRDPDRAEPGVTPLTADLPCGHAFIGGSHCKSRDLAWHDGSKGKHAYVPWERRKGERRTLDAATPRPGLVEAALLAAELVDNAWTDHGDHIEYSDDLPEALARLRRAYGALLDAEFAALASGTEEPGLDENPCCYSLHEFEQVCQRTGHTFANDKGANPTPEPK